MGDEITDKTRADWTEARHRVAACLKYAHDGESNDALLGLCCLLKALKEGTLDELSAFVLTLTSLHLALLTQDSECDEEEVAADLQSPTTPSWDRFFELLVRNTKSYYVPNL